MMKARKNTQFALAATLIAVLSLVAVARLPGGANRPMPPASASAAAPESPPDRSPEYDYDPPIPGSYQLPPLQTAANGPVLGPTGKPVRLHELFADRVVVLSFIYTRCADPRACLRATSVLSQLQKLSRQEPDVARKMQLITLSFDPGYDTPEVMQRYGSVFGQGQAGAPWLFLTTGSQADLQPLLDAYGQRVDKRRQPSPLGPYQHTLKVFLIDPQHRLRNVYSYGLLDPRLVLADVKTLLLEQKPPAGD